MPDRARLGDPRDRDPPSGRDRALQGIEAPRPLRRGGNARDRGDRPDRPSTRARPLDRATAGDRDRRDAGAPRARSEEHTSELQSLMRISYAVFCLKNKTKKNTQQNTDTIPHQTSVT